MGPATHRTGHPPLPILYRDDRLVAIHKPPGVLVHRTGLASRDERFLLQELRDQLGCRVYPLHRLDRATYGVLLFALSPETAAALGPAFGSGGVHKVYWAVVRGWTQPEGTIDHPVRDRDTRGAPRAAQTRFRRLAQVELPVAVDRYPSSRYCLVEARPQSGRRHQLRAHFKHIHHPIIGDTSYGNGRHNRFFRERLGMGRLLLHARALGFRHPMGGAWVEIDCPPDAAWQALMGRLGWGSGVGD